MNITNEDFECLGNEVIGEVREYIANEGIEHMILPPKLVHRYSE